MQIGSKVKALRGKESGKEFVVVRIDEKFVYLADGKRLKAQKPKKKSLQHIVLCKGELPLDEVELLEERVNAKIKKFLKE